MRVYLNSYIWGEGYTMKCFEAPDGPLEEFSIGSNRMPECERKIFTNTGAHLFLGIIESIPFGCARMLETGQTEENGRKCYNNIAFEGNSSEIDMVWAILFYARYHYRDFTGEINQMVYYQELDYSVDRGIFTKLLEKCQGMFQKEACLARRGFLVPEGTVEYFFSNTGIPIHKDDVGDVVSFGKIKEEDYPMKIFFYCSAPSTGFVLKQIHFETGEVLNERKEAADVMPPNAFALMTRSGANMALYQVQDEVCFVAKNIRSVTTDHYGRNKCTSIAFAASKEKRKLLSQFAAWALLDFQAFSVALTDCLEVFDGPKGYCVNIKMLHELLNKFAKTLYFDSPKHNSIWKKLLKNDPDKKFQYLVLESTMDYFERSTEIRVSKSQVAVLLNEEEKENWNHVPLNLNFEEDLYRPLSLEVATERPPYKQEIREESLNSQKDEKVFATESGGNLQSEVEKDYIDLLTYQWFKLVLIAGGIVILGIIIYLIKHWLSK